MNIIKQWLNIENEEKKSNYFDELRKQDQKRLNDYLAKTEEGYDAVMVALQEMKNHKMITDEQYNSFGKVAFKHYHQHNTRHYPTIEFLQEVFEEINNPNYKVIARSEYNRDHVIFDLLSHSKAERIVIETRHDNIIIIPNYKNLLNDAKSILEKRIADKEKEFEDFKAEHKADFELMERIKQAERVVNIDWHNLYHVGIHNNRLFKTLVSTINEEMGKL